jgi:hypothetical protein
LINPIKIFRLNKVRVNTIFRQNSASTRCWLNEYDDIRVFKEVVVMSKLDDDFFDDAGDYEEIDITQSKKELSDKKRLLRERIELREIARNLEMDTDDWKEAFPDI